jgi:hypothetical protein
MVFFEDGVLNALSQAATTEPVIATERGSLYLLPDQAVGAARLNGTFSQYEEFLQSLDENLRPGRQWIVPVHGQSFHVLIDAPIKVRNGKTFVGEREVVFL